MRPTLVAVMATAAVWAIAVGLIVGLTDLTVADALVVMAVVLVFLLHAERTLENLR